MGIRKGPGAWVRQEAASPKVSSQGQGPNLNEWMGIDEEDWNTNDAWSQRADVTSTQNRKEPAGE